MPVSTPIEDYDPDEWGMGDGAAWSVVVGRFMQPPVEDDQDTSDTQPEGES